MKSTRPDGRGHWPAGKRRHADTGRWSRIRLAVGRFLEQHYQPAVISGRALAAAVGVDERQIRRYLAGEDRPSPEVQEAIEGWIAERRKQLR